MAGNSTTTVVPKIEIWNSFEPFIGSTGTIQNCESAVAQHQTTSATEVLTRATESIQVKVEEDFIENALPVEASNQTVSIGNSLVSTSTTSTEQILPIKRTRGRPRKNPAQPNQNESTFLPEKFVARLVATSTLASSSIATSTPSIKPKRRKKLFIRIKSSPEKRQQKRDLYHQFKAEQQATRRKAAKPISYNRNCRVIDYLKMDDKIYYKVDEKGEGTKTLTSKTVRQKYLLNAIHFLESHVQLTNSLPFESIVKYGEYLKKYY